LLLCLDFDGTLVPHADDPTRRDCHRKLNVCCYHFRLSLRLPSRSSAVARGLICWPASAIPGLIYAGNHGLEISGPGFLFVEPAAAAHRAALQELANVLQLRLQPIEGARVEDKGLTLTVHYRQVESLELMSSSELPTRHWPRPVTRSS